MIHIKKYESIVPDSSDIFKGLYVTTKQLDMTYCRFLDRYPRVFRASIREICNIINTKYKNKIVVKMLENVQPGLIIKHEFGNDIADIAKEVYELFHQRDINVRVVYGEGNLEWITDDIHSCDGELLVKIGRYSDSKRGKYGIFEANI